MLIDDHLQQIAVQMQHSKESGWCRVVMVSCASSCYRRGPCSACACQSRIMAGSMAGFLRRRLQLGCRELCGCCACLPSVQAISISGLTNSYFYTYKSSNIVQELQLRPEGNTLELEVKLQDALVETALVSTVESTAVVPVLVDNLKDHILVWRTGRESQEAQIFLIPRTI